MNFTYLSNIMDLKIPCNLTTLCKEKFGYITNVSGFFAWNEVRCLSKPINHHKNRVT